MPEKTTFQQIVDEVITEEIDIIEELIGVEIKPLISYKKQLANKAFNKLYTEVLELEKEV